MTEAPGYRSSIWMRAVRDRRVWIAMVILAGIVGLHLVGVGEVLTVDTLKAYRKSLIDLVERHTLAAASAYVAIYILATALSVPGAVVLTLSGGFLFGAFYGAALAVVGATIGATALFLIARNLMNGRTLDRFGPKAAALGERIRDDAWSYLLVLRLVPLFPFFLVNIVPAFVGVRLKVFVLTTFFGIIPGTVVYSLAGAGLGTVFDTGQEFSVSSVLTPQVLAALGGLAVFALIAIPIRARFGDTKATQTGDRGSDGPGTRQPDIIREGVSISTILTISTISCPSCGHRESVEMPVDACQYFYDCKGCGNRLRPKPGDCCVFCSYGTVPCPPVQSAGRSKP
jgi:uncharacterized membrane protein YdjX (TVP38/TMEM64 family)